MALIKNGTVAADPWRWVPDEAELPDAGDIIIGLERWQRERQSLRARPGRLGIRLKSDQLIETIAEDLECFALIALEFPKFNDGRAFSTGRLLRERHGYQGELRAVGHLIQDQFLFLQRCGFDALEVDERADLAAWEKAIAAISVFYQEAADGRVPAARQRQVRLAACRTG